MAFAEIARFPQTRNENYVETIRTANECVHTETVSWVSYPNKGRVCFVYPRYLLDSEEWKAIDADAFPNNGSFLGTITSGAQSSDIQEQYGSIVVARINANTFEVNQNYETGRSDRALYKAAINPTFLRGRSELEFDVFSDHVFSVSLVQIVNLADNTSLMKPLSKPVFITDDTTNLVCRLVLVKNSSGRLFGPFEYTKKSERAIELMASSENDYRVAEFDAIDNDQLFRINDEYGTQQCVFLEKRVIDDIFSKLSMDEKLDWMPQKELLDIIARAINASDEFNGLTRSQLQSVKSAIWDYSDSSSQLVLDDNRRQRIEDLLSSIDSWVELPEQIMRSITESVDEKQLLNLVLDERYYPLFKERIMESAEVQDFVADEKKKLLASLSDINRQREEAIKAKSDAERDAEQAKLQAAQAHEQLEKVRDEALEQKREELNALENSISERSAKLHSLEGEYERAIVNKDKIEHDVENIISGINDEVATSTKILESEILRKVVAAVSGVDLREDDNEPVAKYGALRSDEDSMSDDEIIDVIFESISQRAGRQISRNDTIDLLICLTQGYITTFAGLPGTGKTSLCNILAGSLGLTNAATGKRFTEINVENGWTSYKDYVGYYNPLAKRYEKSNTAVYDAMHLLSKEQSGASGVPPYVFLLDEANLSPIEHYWSPFLRACDTFQEDGTQLSLGGTEIWQLPNHVRFLATVNFDHTTEALSHRFLDRSWVITLDPDYIDTDYKHVNIAKEFSSESAFSSSRLNKAFGIRPNDSLNQDNETLLEDLIRTCRAHSFAISPRSQLMMKRFIATASRLMSLQSKDSQYAPLDYAFSQKILPQIVGPAEIVGALVDDLADKCSQLKITKRQLDKMKAFGEDSGFYQYFI